MRVTDRAIDDIIDLITVQKVYQAGDKLPNENELARQLNMSRTSIRSALQYLNAQGIVRVERGRGTYVAEVKQMNQDDSFQALSIVKHKMHDLYELRSMIEPHLAALAAERASEEELQEIHRLEEKLEGTFGNSDINEDIDGNAAFHLAIARASHNEFAIQLMQILSDTLSEEFRKSGQQQTLYQSLVNDHKLILNYLRERDAEGARQAMQLHMVHTIRRYHLTEEKKKRENAS